MKTRQEEFETAIKPRLGDCMHTRTEGTASGETLYPESDSPGGSSWQDIVYEEYNGLYGEPKYALVNADDIPNYDEYVGAEVMLPKDGEHMQTAKVVRRVRDDMGMLKGSYNQNPILDT